MVRDEEQLGGGRKKLLAIQTKLDAGFDAIFRPLGQWIQVVDLTTHSLLLLIVKWRRRSEFAQD